MITLSDEMILFDSLNIILALVTIGSAAFALFEHRKRVHADKELGGVKNELVDLRSNANKMYQELSKHATDEARKWALIFG